MILIVHYVVPPPVLNYVNGLRNFRRSFRLKQRGSEAILQWNKRVESEKTSKEQAPIQNFEDARLVQRTHSDNWKTRCTPTMALGFLLFGFYHFNICHLFIWFQLYLNFETS